MKTKTGGESGIRTRDRLFTYTRFPGVLLQPLGHLTGLSFHMDCGIIYIAVRSERCSFYCFFKGMQQLFCKFC